MPNVFAWYTQWLATRCQDAHTGTGTEYFEHQRRALFNDGEWTRFAERREVYQLHAVGELSLSARANRQREPGLADTAGPGQRHQPLFRNHSFHFGAFVFTTDKAGEW
jgi:hypothetical protein